MQEGEVVGGFPVSSGRDSAHALHPGVGALHGPTLGCLGISGPDCSLLAAPDFPTLETLQDRLSGLSPLRDMRLDLSGEERLAQGGGVIAAIGPDSSGMDASGKERVNERKKMPSLVLVAGRETDLER